jgi:hypothetical protein
MCRPVGTPVGGKGEPGRGPIAGTAVASVVAEMASDQLEQALHYLTRSGQPNVGALRALGEAELRALKTLLRGRADVPPTVARAIDSLIVERRAHRRRAGRVVDSRGPDRAPRATLRTGVSLLALLASAVGLAVLLVHTNRWP